MARKGPPAIFVMEYESASNSSQKYEVRISRTDGALYCTCAGWRFNKTCRHTDETTKDDIVAALKEACRTGVLGI